MIIILLLRNSERKRVRYRLLMSFNILKDFHNVLTLKEKEEARAGLFPTEESYNEQALEIIAECNYLVSKYFNVLRCFPNS